MDRIRYFADLSVRRGSGLGLVAIGLVVMALHFDLHLAMHALALLLTFEAAALFLLSFRAHSVPFQRREVWALMEGEHGMGDRVQRVVNEVMRETFLAYARRLAGPVVAAWVVDIGLTISA